jgi:hypothetical protein
MAHQWRNQIASLLEKALREKPMAQVARHWLFPKGALMAQQRTKGPIRADQKTESSRTPTRMAGPSLI